MLTFYLEAESLDELKAKAMAALGIVNGVKAEAPAAAAPEPVIIPEPVTASPAPVEAKPVPDKQKRKPRATKPPVVAPVPVDEPMDDVDLGSFEEDVFYVEPEEALQGLTPVSTPLVDTLANEKLKAEVIDRLADLFTAGKVKLLRSLLDTYGSGAKTFAEIDPGIFPKIRDAMQKGMDS